MHRQPVEFPLHMCSGFPMEKVDDVTMITHAIWGGKYIKRAHSGFGLLSQFLVLYVWSVKSLTLYSSYISASLGQEYTQYEPCSLFIHVHAPDVLGTL